MNKLLCLLVAFWVVPVTGTAQNVNQAYVIDSVHGKISFQPIEGITELEKAAIEPLLDEIIQVHTKNRKGIKAWSGIAKTKFWQRKNAKEQGYLEYHFTLDNVKHDLKYFVYYLRPKEDKTLQRFGYGFKMQVDDDIYLMGPIFDQFKVTPRLEIKKGQLRPALNSGDFSPMQYLKVFSDTLEERLNKKKKDLQPGSFSDLRLFKAGSVVRILGKRKMSSNKFWMIDVELKKGGNIVQMISRFNTETFIANYQYEQKGDLWLLQRFRTALFYDKPDQKQNDNCFALVLDNKLNEKIPEDAFKLSGLDLPDNVIIDDKRSGQRYRLKPKGSSKQKDKL